VRNRTDGGQIKSLYCAAIQRHLCSMLICSKKHPVSCVLHATACLLEVAGVAFSDSDPAPVPKFLNPGPEIFDMSESDSCSDSSYNRGNRKLPTVSLWKYSASSIIRPYWATFFQNLGRIRKVSIVGYPPSTTYTTLKRT